MKHASIGVPRRRDEALAVIIDHWVRTGTSPSFEEIGRGMKPPVSKARAIELVDELVVRGDIVKTPGAQRALHVRDVAGARAIFAQIARSLGWIVAPALGDLQQPFPHVQLPLLPPFKHLPDAE